MCALLPPYFLLLTYGRSNSGGGGGGGGGSAQPKLVVAVVVLVVVVVSVHLASRSVINYRSKEGFYSSLFPPTSSATQPTYNYKTKRRKSIITFADNSNSRKRERASNIMCTSEPRSI